MTDEAEGEAGLMAVLDAFAKALWSKDLEALRACYADDVRVFDVATQLEGFQSLRALWEGCLPYFPNPIGVERRDVRSFVGRDLAVVTFFSRLTGMETDHPAARSWLRTTVCLQKRNDRWKIIHDHISYAVDCGAEKPAYILD